MKRILLLLAYTSIIAAFVCPSVLSSGVAIGNAHYTDGSSDLPKATNDANDMATVIKGSAGIKVDRDEGEMRGDVAGTNGSVPPRVIFFSSHGAEGPPAEIVGVDGTRYDAGELAVDLDCGNNEGTLVIVDACYSGGMADPAVAECCIFLTACEPDECASTKLNRPKDARNSEFTEHILAGVRGGADAPPNGNGDGQTSLAELDAYLTANYDGDDHHHQLLGMEKPWADDFRPFKSVPELVPSLTNWGLIILLSVLILLAATVLYRRGRVATD